MLLVGYDKKQRLKENLKEKKIWSWEPPNYATMMRPNQGSQGYIQGSERWLQTPKVRPL